MFTEEILSKLTTLAKLSRAYFPENKANFYLINDCVATDYIILPLNEPSNINSNLNLNKEKLMTKAGQVRKNPKIEIISHEKLNKELDYNTIKLKQFTYCNKDGVLVTGQRTLTKKGIIITLDENVKSIDSTFKRHNY